MDAGTSTVDASPAAVLADGTSTSTITVTLRDAVGTPVGSEGVTLANRCSGHADDQPVPDPDHQWSRRGDLHGQLRHPGTKVFTATSATDSVVVTDTASVEFQSACGGCRQFHGVGLADRRSRE